MERQWRNPSDVMKTRSIRKKKVRPHTCWLCSLIVLARVKITLSSCVQLQRASSLGGLNKENSPLKSVNRSVNESGAVRKRTAGIALGEQENCPSALTATRTKNSSLCSPSTKVHWPNTANYSLHDAPQVLCAFFSSLQLSWTHLVWYFIAKTFSPWYIYIIYWFVCRNFEVHACQKYRSMFTGISKR